MPEPSAGRFVFHDEAQPEQFKVALKSVIEWQVELAPGASASMEIMLPYSGVDMETAKRILAIDRDKALAEARAFWQGARRSRATASACRTSLWANYAAATPAQMAQQMAYRHTTGVWMLKTSPNHYEIYWPVSGGRALPAFDLLGHT